MRKVWLFLVIMLTGLNGCHQKQDETMNGEPLPRALFITTGIDFDKPRADLPGSVRVAINSFNSRGIPLRMETRDILYQPEKLKAYKFIILSTAAGIHDADRPYSLSYMNDSELNILRDFVKNGGILIAGDNVGRNDYEGNDRIVETGTLNPGNYPLSEVFGAVLSEKNFKGYDLISTGGQEWFLSKNYDLWTVYPDSLLSNETKILAYWKKGNDSIPALLRNSYGKGAAWLLPVSDLINPVQTGGFVSVSQIDNLYREIIDTETGKMPRIWPWPFAKEAAFAMTFNDMGKKKEYRRLLNQFGNNPKKIEFFVHGKLNDTLRELLLNRHVNLSTTGENYLRFSTLDYADATHEWLAPGLKWNYPFSGIRFPFTDPCFAALQSADLNGFLYDSSISADEPAKSTGVFFPYNIAYSGKDFYRASNMLEIPPTFHDDYYFLNEYITQHKFNPHTSKLIDIFEQYLLDYWFLNIKPVHGLMVYLGHPGITAYDENTMRPLQTLIDTLQKQNVWFASPRQIVNYRNALYQTSIRYIKNGNRGIIQCQHPNKIPEGLTVLLPFEADHIQAEQMKIEIRKTANATFITVKSTGKTGKIAWETKE